MTVLRDTLTEALNTYLACSSYTDFTPNGLQVEGKTQIQRICTAVTASEEVVLEAVEQGADALLVHHGYFWRGEVPVITGTKRRRIAPLIRHDINLYAFHLPLDCHPVIGNNACIGRLLGVTDVTSVSAGNTDDLLWFGQFEHGIAPDELTTQLTTMFQRDPQCLITSDTKIRSIAWCSGAAQDFIEDASRFGIDAYLSGEISERTYYQAKELGIHYFACGHHATERFGIQALGEYLSQQFSLDHVFIDTDNPV